MPPEPFASTVWPFTPGSFVTPPAVRGARPRLSLVMPSHNHGRFIEAAMRSVLLQAHPHVELIVMDAASTDQTAEVVDRYRPWLAHAVSEPDAGPADALNKGFARAQGDLFGFLNADDFLLPGALDAVVRWFDSHPDADVVSGHGYMARPSGQLGPALVSDRWNRERFVRGACILFQPATFFRRQPFERVGGFRVDPQHTWDMELWANMSEAGAVFATMDAALAAHRLHPDSITGSAGLRHARLEDARQIRERLLGREESSLDRALAWWHRARKFSQHPGRTLSQRVFCYSTLGRWSL